MRRLHIFVVLLTALLSWWLPARASFVAPPIAGHVTDAAHKLTASEVDALDKKLADYRRCSGRHVAVFLAASLEGQTIEDVAYATFNAWKIGEAKADNGALLVIAPNERKVRIETGKGIGGDLTDLGSFAILRDHVTPHLKQNELFSAVDEGTTAIGQALGGCPIAAARVSDGQSTRKPPALDDDSLPWQLYSAFAFFVGAIGMLLFESVIRPELGATGFFGRIAIVVVSFFSLLGAMMGSVPLAFFSCLIAGPWGGLGVGAIALGIVVATRGLRTERRAAEAERRRRFLSAPFVAQGASQTGSAGGITAPSTYEPAGVSTYEPSFPSTSTSASASASSALPTTSTDSSYSGGGGSSGGGGASDSY